MRALVVTNPFGGHAAGDSITDPNEIETVLNGEHAGHVVATEQPDESVRVAGVQPVGRPRKNPGDVPAFANNASSQE